MPRLIRATEPGFPRRFSELAVPPRQLWVAGRAPAEDGRLVALVGSRAATVAGAARVSDLVAQLVRGGWAVISGGALGIDAAAHRGALDAGGATFAVLGCGIDVVYPDRHARLFGRMISAGGGLLSEYGPGVAPRPGQFPARNRLVAALADVVVVAESRSGSGALITARCAAALGRPLLAIPGSAGADGLLVARRAAPLHDAGDVDDALAGRVRPRRAAALPPGIEALLQALGTGPAAADEIALRLGLPLAETLGILCEAELGGLVVRAAGARFQSRFDARFEGSRGH